MKEIKFKIAATGETVDVSFVSYKEMSELFGKGYGKPLLMAGGFAATYVTAEMLDTLREQFAGNEVALAAIGTSVPGHSVQVLTDVDELISKENGEAIFLHEIGHVVCGHVKAMVEGECEYATDVSHGCQFITDENVEVEADAYAAQFVGYHRLLASISAVLKAQAVISAELSNGKIDADAFFAETMAEAKKSARWQELLKYTEGY